MHATSRERSTGRWFARAHAFWWGGAAVGAVWLLGMAATASQAGDDGARLLFAFGIVAATFSGVVFSAARRSVTSNRRARRGSTARRCSRPSGAHRPRERDRRQIVKQ